jgi:hypothetical protein
LLDEVVINAAIIKSDGGQISLNVPIQQNFMKNISDDLCCMWGWNINESTRKTRQHNKEAIKNKAGMYEQKLD